MLTWLHEGCILPCSLTSWWKSRTARKSPVTMTPVSQKWYMLTQDSFGKSKSYTTEALWKRILGYQLCVESASGHLDTSWSWSIDEENPRVPVMCGICFRPLGHNWSIVKEIPGVLAKCGICFRPPKCRSTCWASSLPSRQTFLLEWRHSSSTPMSLWATMTAGQSFIHQVSQYTLIIPHRAIQLTTKAH